MQLALTASLRGFGPIPNALTPSDIGVILFGEIKYKHMINSAYTWLGLVDVFQEGINYERTSIPYSHFGWLHRQNCHH